MDLLRAFDFVKRLVEDEGTAQVTLSWTSSWTLIYGRTWNLIETETLIWCLSKKIEKVEEEEGKD